MQYNVQTKINMQGQQLAVKVCEIAGMTSFKNHIFSATVTRTRLMLTCLQTIIDCVSKGAVVSYF